MMSDFERRIRKIETITNIIVDLIYAGKMKGEDALTLREQLMDLIEE